MRIGLVSVIVWIGSVSMAGVAQPVGMDAFREAFAPGASAAWKSERVERYIALFDKGVEGRIPSFDFEKGLLALEGSMPPAEVAEMERSLRKEYAAKPEYQWLYRLGRTSASDIGAFALAWACPESKFFEDERLRGGVVRGLEAFLEHQLPSGEFAFSSIRMASCYGTHEMAWRLEPLLAAYLCVRHTLEPDQRARIHGGLAKAFDYLYADLYSSQSNRGCVWCGVVAVGAKIFDRPDCRDALAKNWAWVGGRVFPEVGQVVEGPGPDMGYSYISHLYAFRMRATLGSMALEDRLANALDWFYTMHDSQGFPFQAVSTRTHRFSSGYLTYLMGALEFYARERPYFSTIAQEYLAILEKSGEGFITDHGGIPWMTAIMSHDPSIKPEPLPSRLLRYTNRHEYDVTRYYAVRRAYRTLIPLSEMHEYSGVQHWCLDGERPILSAFPGGASRVTAWGIDTARINVGGGRARANTDVTAMTTVTVDWGGLTTCYVLGERATWVVNVALEQEREVSWAINGQLCPPPMLDALGVGSEEQRSRIDMGPRMPRLEQVGKHWLLKSALPSSEAMDWTIFHDGSAQDSKFSHDAGIITGLLKEGEVQYRLVLNTSGTTIDIKGVSVAPMHAAVAKN